MADVYDKERTLLREIAEDRGAIPGVEVLAWSFLGLSASPSTSIIRGGSTTRSASG